MKCLPFIILLFICSVSHAQLQADFSASATSLCSGSTVQFQDNSSGNITQWFWDFGNGITSSAQNPSVAYTTAGRYTVRLIVRNDSLEAIEQKDSYITVSATPKPVFTVSGINGCAPVNSVFTNTSDLQGATAASWLWDFKDGNTSASQNPTHTFTAAGQYNVSLTVQTTDGCSATYTRTRAVVAGTEPVANFSASPLSGCASSLRQFTNQSAGNITQYTWNFGDGGTSNLSSPLYHYKDTGLFTVRLTVSDNGCTNTLERTHYMQVTGPVALYRKQVNCAQKFMVSYSDLSIGEQSRLWDFGDGTTSDLSTVTHTYNSPGVYVIRLIATGTSCSDTTYDTARIGIGNPTIELSPVTSFYCKYTPIQFSVADYDTVGIRTFSWNFGDGPNTSFSSSYSTLSNTYKQSGNFIPQVYLRNDENCVDTISLTAAIEIKGPAAAFDSVAAGCSDRSIRLTNRSTAYANVPISQWLWTFGDGDSLETQGSASYEYPFPGTYKITLKVTDTDGCYDSIAHSIQIAQTPLVEAGPDTLVCAGSNIVLNPVGATDYTWNSNPDLSCTNCTNPVASPSGDSVVYHVTGASEGCTASDSIKIHIQNQEFVTVQPDVHVICQGSSVTLNATGTDDYVWAPSTGMSDTAINNPVVTPTVTTVYTVTGKDSNNCFTDATTVTVTVNPRPTVNIMDSVAEQMIGSSYTITSAVSPDAVALDWNPKTGLSCYNCLQPVAIVNATTMYTLTATNQFGCSSTDSITIISVCKGQSFYMPNTFSPNNDGMNDYFYPRAGTPFTISSLVVFNRWGQKLFEKRNFPANNYTYGWDGKYQNKEQAPDVYIYMMELQCTDGSKIIRKGNLTLLR